MNCENKYKSPKNDLIAEIDGKMRNMDLDSKLDDINSISDHGHPSLSQNNYYNETSYNSNSTNYLFHINFVQSMRPKDRRLPFENILFLLTIN